MTERQAWICVAILSAIIVGVALVIRAYGVLPT
jgi:hypothetical protein